MQYLVESVSNPVIRLIIEFGNNKKRILYS